MSSAALRMTIGVLFLAISVVPLGNASAGLVTRESSRAGHPMRYMVTDPLYRLERHRLSHAGEAIDHEEELSGARVPGVIIAHGFAASERSMLAYAHVLALAGYAVVLTDFVGHGLNAMPFDGESLQEGIDHAYAVLVAQPEVDAERIALLGHSMGSSAVMVAARRSPERYRATIAVSPVRASVTSSTPRNLLLQAGTWEPRYLRNAEFLLQRAGGPSDDFSSGRARALTPIAGAEHLSILFRHASHQGVVQWLDRALEFDPPERLGYKDRRIIWWLVHVLGWMFIVASLAPVHSRDVDREQNLVRRPLQWVGIAAAPILASLVIVGLARLIDVGNLGGMMVGGGLALWLLIAGTLALAVGFRVGSPTGRDLAWGVGLFVFLWFVVGMTSDYVWLNWHLVTPRLVRFPLFALACIPWFTATELLQGDPSGRSRWPAYLVQVVTLIAGLLLIAAWVPTMQVVALMLPVLPLVVGCLVFVGSRVNRPWAYGIGAGMFFGWLLASAFPLVA